MTLYEQITERMRIAQRYDHWRAGWRRFLPNQFRLWLWRAHEWRQR